MSCAIFYMIKGESFKKNTVKFIYHGKCNVNDPFDFIIRPEAFKNNYKYQPYKKKFAVMWASTLNLGDDFQTLAAVNMLIKNNINEFIFIDREKLSDYDGPPVVLLMNGWYMHDLTKFPPSDNITPIFISFHTSNENLIKKNRSYFLKYQPIGCRDTSTRDLFKKYDIKAYFSGCLTTCFDEYNEKGDKKYITDINQRVSYIPNVDVDLNKYKDYEIINHNLDSANDKENLIVRLFLAANLLKKYQKANLVLTSRLHCVLPCRAFNTNVKFIHKNYDSDARFEGLKDVINGNSKDLDNIKSTINREFMNDFKEILIKDVRNRLEKFN